MEVEKVNTRGDADVRLRHQFTEFGKDSGPFSFDMKR